MIRKNNLSFDLLEQFNGLCWLKNTDNVYIYANQNSAKALGYSTAKELIGNTDYQIRSPIVCLAGEFVTEDAHVIRQNKFSKSISFGPYYRDGNYKMWMRQKNLVFDNKDQLVGVQAIAIDITENKNLLNMILLSNQGFMPHTQTYFCIQLTDYYPNIDLGRQETLTLFYLLRGKSSKEIGDILSLSARTIDAYIEKIKFKTNTKSRLELVAKCIHEGFINIFPAVIGKKLLQKGRL